MTLVTGVAGFIGSSVAVRLLSQGESVIGVDNLNDYYDVSLKEARLARLEVHENFQFIRADVADRAAIARVFDLGPRRVVHLAAQAGVRYSIQNPHAFIESNVVGFMNVLEGARRAGVEHLVYASSSSVYGGNAQLPFSESQSVDHPVSLYAATKKANELMAHAYSHLFRLPTTGLRFFTVYGPWGRPDMALFLFARAMLAGQPIDVFNDGRMVRDFTFIDDIVEGITRVLACPATPNADFDPRKPDPSTSNAPYRVFNIGNGQARSLEDYISALERSLAVRAHRRYLPLQPGDMVGTEADTSALAQCTGFRPSTSVEDGVQQFATWYREYYRTRSAP